MDSFQRIFFGSDCEKVLIPRKLMVISQAVFLICVIRVALIYIRLVQHFTIVAKGKQRTIRT